MRGAAGGLLVFGEVLFDRFPDGSLILGGAPFNVAWNLQALGLAPLFVSRVGDDALGERILRSMADWGMETTGVQRDPGHATGTVEVTLAGGEPSYEIVADRAYDHIDADLLPQAQTAGLVYHGTLALRHPVSRHAMVALRRPLERSVFVDVNLRDPWWDRDAVLGDLRGARWAKLNADELEHLTAGALPPEEQASRLLEQTDLHGLIVTRGAGGAAWYGPGGDRVDVRPQVAVPVVDTVGAGDAFASVVLAGLLREWDWPLILERAQHFAAAVVGLHGATCDDRTFYQPFAKEWSDI